MKITVSPGNSLNGSVHLPGDKSISHRAALLAAMAEGESRFDNYLIAGVTKPLLEALKMLGVHWELEGTTLWVRGVGIDGFQSPAAPLDCGNSATVLRLLAGALSAAGIGAVLDGSDGLRRRPMQRIIEPLLMMGVSIRAAEGGRAPLSLAPRASDPHDSMGKAIPLRPLSYRMPIASAQVKSCLLLAALVASGPTTLIEPGPSRDHTERMLRSMGVYVSTEELAENTFKITLIPPLLQAHRFTRSLTPLRLVLPGDFSSAAFLIVAGLITPGSEIILCDVGLNPTRTGLLEALTAMGAEIVIAAQSERGGEPVGDLIVRYTPLHGVTVDGSLVVRMIDEFPAFAIAAVYAHGETVVRDATELRHKESDRIAALGEELRALGIQFTERPDGFAIAGGRPIQGGVVFSHGDHRLAMSMILAGLAATRPVTVQGAEVIAESFPNFIDVLRSLGAELTLED